MTVTKLNQTALSLLVEPLRHLQFRGKARMLHFLSPRSGERSAVVFGAIFHLDLEDYIQRSIFLGTFEPDETRLVSRYLQQGMTVVDVGANVGYFTALSAKMVGSRGRVASFEPSPYAFQRLSGMISENQLTHVKAVNVGLSDVPGSLNLYLGKEPGNHAPTMIAHENTTKTSVPVQTLDLEMTRLGIDQVDLLKIDVEGYEMHVFAGAKRLLRERRIKAVLCEFNESWLEKAGASGAQLEELLIAAGFVEKPCAAQHLAVPNRFFLLPDSTVKVPRGSA